MEDKPGKRRLKNEKPKIVRFITEIYSVLRKEIISVLEYFYMLIIRLNADYQLVNTIFFTKTQCRDK